MRDNAGWMLVLAERMLNDAALAEDVVQEALISAINGLDRFEEKSSLKTWLHRITVNAALSKIRKQKRLAEQDRIAKDGPGRCDSAPPRAAQFRITQLQVIR